MSKPVEIGELKEGGFCIIDNEPCRIVSVEKSKPGKHGSAKARIDVPIIEKRTGQIIAALGNNTYQLMDLENFETFESKVDEELVNQLAVGDQVEYWVILNRRKIMRKK